MTRLPPTAYGRGFSLLDLSSGSQPGRGITCPVGRVTELLDARASDADNARIVTAQVTPVLQGLAPADWPAARVICTWGVHGATHTATMDLSQGFSLSLCADFLRLAVDYPASVPNRAPTPGPALQVDASLSWGTKAGSAGSPRLTSFLANVPAGGESAAVELPRFARAVGVLGAPNPAMGAVTPDVHLRFYGTTGVVIAEAIDALHMSSEWAAATIPLGTRFVRIQNNEPANAIQRPAVVIHLGI